MVIEELHGQVRSLGAMAAHLTEESVSPRCQEALLRDTADSLEAAMWAKGPPVIALRKVAKFATDKFAG